MRWPPTLASSLPLALLFLAAAPLCSTATQDKAATDPRQERDALQRRHEEIELRLARQAPVAVKKMGLDPSEKFYPEYWIFDGDSRSSLLDADVDDQQARTNGTSVNATLWHGLLPAILPHRFDNDKFSNTPRGLRPAQYLDKRSYQCPAEYHNCASIGYKDSCCGPSETCQIIRDTGIGVVGCCPDGAHCAGSVSSCDIAKGYKSCPRRRNKNGCCAPGFSCDAIGCIQTRGGRVVTITTSTYLTQTHTRTLTPAVQSTRFITTTITNAIPPVRPTSLSLVSFATTKTLGGICPTGFYRCQAYYGGGCCRVGRDCRSTDCPERASVAATGGGSGGNDVTVVVVTGVGATTVRHGTTVTLVTSRETFTVGPQTTIPGGGGGGGGGLRNDGNCAPGWGLCAAADGGSCCPSGYRCAASSSCLATAAGLPGKVPKATPLSQARALEACGPWMAALAGALGVGMVLL